MNEHIIRQLQSESTSDSRGYVAPHHDKHLVLVADQPSGLNEALARWSRVKNSQIPLTRLAGVRELLALATSQEVAPP